MPPYIVLCHRGRRASLRALWIWTRLPVVCSCTCWDDGSPVVLSPMQGMLVQRLHHHHHEGHNDIKDDPQDGLVDSISNLLCHEHFLKLFSKEYVLLRLLTRSFLIRAKNWQYQVCRLAAQQLRFLTLHQ